LYIGTRLFIDQFTIVSHISLVAKDGDIINDN